MKKLLSLTLTLVMLLCALSACSVRSNDSDTDTSTEIDTNSEIDTETDTSAEIDVNSDTSIDISTDTNADSSGGGTACPDDIVNYNPTINNFQIDSEKTNIYYEPLVLGVYQGRDVPSSNGNILYETNFDFGWYYLVIKSYEELEAIVEKPENVNPNIFEECYILLVSYYDRTTSKYQILGFRDLIFNEESKELCITADGVYSGIVGEAVWVYNLYLSVPKSTDAHIDISALTHGNMSFNFNKTSQVAHDYVTNSTGLQGVENGSTWLFDSDIDLENKLVELDPSFKIPPSIEDEEEELLLPVNPEEEQIKKKYAFLLTYRGICNCYLGELLGYDDLYVEDDIAYITLKALDKHTENCSVKEPKLWVACIETDILFCKGIKIVVKTEKQLVSYYTSYSQVEKSEFFRYDHFYIEC